MLCVPDTRQNDPKHSVLSLESRNLLLSTPNCCCNAKFSRARSRRSLKATTIEILSHRSVSIIGRIVEGIG